VTELPDIATIGEFVPGYEASTWYGIGVPKDRPTEIIEAGASSSRCSPARPLAARAQQANGCGAWVC
jgi:hypothetical protein